MNRLEDWDFIKTLNEEDVSKIQRLIDTKDVKNFKISCTLLISLNIDKPTILAFLIKCIKEYRKTGTWYINDSNKAFISDGMCAININTYERSTGIFRTDVWIKAGNHYYAKSFQSSNPNEPKELIDFLTTIKIALDI